MTFKTILKTSGTILEYSFFAVLIFFFAVIVSPLLPSKSTLATYAVVTGSMEPHIPVGSLAFVRSQNPATLKVGDIITFPDPTDSRRIIIHRIAEVLGEGQMIEFRTKGDNNPNQDEWLVNGKSVTGKMITSFPNVGKPILFAQTPIGYALLVGGPALILSIINIKNIVEGVREELSKRSASLKAQPVAA